MFTRCLRRAGLAAGYIDRRQQHDCILRSSCLVFAQVVSQNVDARHRISHSIGGMDVLHWWDGRVALVGW
eukprot:6203113-Pleurochrysis_carterae.AAC.1